MIRLEFACKDKSCAPPPVGTGGSVPTTANDRMSRAVSHVGAIDNAVFSPKLGLADDDVDMTAGVLARTHAALHVGAARTIGADIAGEIDWTEITDGRWIADGWMDMMSDSEYASNEVHSGSSYDDAVKRTDVAQGIRDDIMHGNYADAAATMKKYGVTPEEVIAYKLISDWNRQNEEMCMRLRERAATVLPMQDGGHVPESDVLAGMHEISRSGFERNLKRSRDGVPDDVLDATLKAVYASTQKVLRDSGVTEVTVARGVSFFDPEPFVGGKFKQPQVDVRLRGLSSYTGSGTTAREFAGGGMVIITKVPASQVMSTALTGFGTVGEAEVVVLGGTYRSTLLSAVDVESDDDVSRRIDA